MKDKKILIVDDSPSMLIILGETLRKEGYMNVSRANGGKEAIAVCNEEKPDLVLLDVIMEEVNGLEVLDAIGKTTKVVVVSAVGQEAVIDEAKQKGAVDYLVKPVNSKDLLNILERHLGK